MQQDAMSALDRHALVTALWLSFALIAICLFSYGFDSGGAWATAGGFAGGPTNAETFILIANTGATPGSARVTVVFESGPRIAHTFSLPAQSRTSVPVSPLTPLTAGQRFSVLVESLGASPAPLVVERAMYDSPAGVTWAAGTAMVATPLTP